jgi:putative ABC transport system permease protein
MSGVIQDLRLACRLMGKFPAHTTAAVLTLALGIGTATVIFSVVDALYLRPMPVIKPEQLVRVSNYLPERSQDDRSSYAEWRDYTEQANSLAGITAVSRRGALVKDRQNEFVQLLSNLIAPNYFDVMGVKAFRGRTFTQSELNDPNAAPVVLIGYDAWISHFGGDPAVVGSPLVISKTACVIVGVLPPGFRGTDILVNPDLWIPYTTWVQINPEERDWLNNRKNRGFELFARLKPNVTIGTAQAQMEQLAASFGKEYPIDARRRITLVPSDSFRSEMKSLSVLLISIAVLVILICYANLSNLVLARVESRYKEFGTRIAHGGTRTRLLWQLVFEAAPLVIVGTAIAVLLSTWGLQVFPKLLPAGNVFLRPDLRVDARVLLVTSSLSLLSILVVGAIPAFRVFRLQPAEIMRSSSTGIRRLHAKKLSHITVVVQIALSLMLLTSASLLLKSAVKMTNTDPGFNSQQQVLLMDLNVGFAHLGKDEVRQYLNTVLTKVLAVPGVGDAAVARFVPLANHGGGAVRNVSLRGRPTPDGTVGIKAGYTEITPTYFKVIGTRILRGRPIGSEDRTDSAPVVVISHELARQLFADQDPLGQLITAAESPDRLWQVVGVAEDAKYNDLTESAQPFLYFPISQSTPNDATLVIKTAVNAADVAPALTQVVSGVNRSIPITDVHTLQEHMRSQTYEQRMGAGIATFLAILGTVLSSLGLYGIVSYSVSQETNAIAVRIAVGAGKRAILRQIIAQSLVLGAWGTMLGLIASFAFGHYLSTLLYGISTKDPASFVLVIAVILLTCVLASAFPAWRACQVSPAVSLRYE